MMAKMEIALEGAHKHLNHKLKVLKIHLKSC